ncbi:MAG: AI-2E family transporter [bacterium]
MNPRSAATPNSPTTGDGLSILNIRNILTLAAVGGAIYVLFVIRGVIALFLSAIVIAFLLYPLVKWLERVRIGKRELGTTTAIIIVFLVFAGLLGLVLFLLVSLMQEQIMNLYAALQAEALDDKIKQAQQWIDDNASLASRFGLDPLKLKESLRATVEHYLGPEAIAQAYNFVSARLDPQQLASNAGNIITVVLSLPILVYYMISDAKAIKQTLMSFIPPAFVSPTNGFLHELERTLNNYLRGQLKLGFYIFMLDAVLLLLFTKLHSWFLLAAVAGFTEVIPIVGPTIAMIVALIVAGVETGGNVAVLGAIAIIFIGVQMFENQFLVPRVMGKQLDVHPLTVMFCLLAGLTLGGAVGALLSLPVAATLKVMFKQYYPTFIRRVQDLLVDDTEAPAPG